MAKKMKTSSAQNSTANFGIEAKLDYLPYVAPVMVYRADFKTKVPQP